jgi:hypothetical protein
LPLDVRQGILDGIKGQRIIAGAHADVRGGVCPMVAADVSWQSVAKSSVATAQQAARAWDRYAEASGSSRTATKRQLLALTSMLEASILKDLALTEPPLSEAIADHERTKSGLHSIAIPTVPARDAVTDAPAAQPTYLGLADAIEVVPTERPTQRPRPVEMPAARPSAVELPAEVPSAVELPAEVPSAVELPAEVPSAVEPPAERPDASAKRRSARKRQDTGERDRTSELAERGGWAWMRPFRSYDEYEETLLRALAELDSQERQLEELQVR